MDRLYCDLAEKAESVHFEMMPGYCENYIDSDLEERMDFAQLTSSMVLALRRKVNIKVRQPLAKIIIPVLDAHVQEQIEKVKQLVLNEVNLSMIPQGLSPRR